MKIEYRNSFGWPAHPNVATAPCKNGTVVHYDGSNKGLANKSHDACREYWQWCRRFHMTDAKHKWSDIGYSFGVCPHGIILEGRGWGYTQAAQPGGNTTWTSATFMSGKTETPTPKQILAYRELRSWLRGKGLESGERPHGDFTSTDCPGPILATMVKSGTLRGKVVTAPPSSPGTTAPLWPLPRGHWFGRESSNSKNHSGYYADDRPSIRNIVDRLTKRGWKGLAATGVWTPTLTSVVRKFQAEKKLPITGLVDEATWKQIWEAKIT